MNEKTIQTILAVAAAIGMVSLGLALLVAAFNLGSELAVWWLVFIFQILIMILGGVTAVVFTIWVLSFPFQAITTRLDTLQKAHAKILADLRERIPTFVAFGIVISEVLMVIADKSFGGDPQDTVTVSVVLLVLFGIGNQLMLTDSKLRFTAGAVVWVFGVLLLPLTATLHRNGFDKLLEDLNNLNLATKITFVLVVLCLLLMPFAIPLRRST